MTSKHTTTTKPTKRKRTTKKELDDLFGGYAQLDSLSKLQMEQDLSEANPWHDEKGRLSGPDKGHIYSISKDGARRSGISSDYAKKGISTGNKDSKGKTKTTPRYTMASGKKACGRKDVQTGDRPYKYKCSDYPEKVNEVDANTLSIDRAYLRQIFRQELANALSKLARKRTGQAQCTIEQVVKILNTIELSKKGKAFEPGNVSTKAKKP